MKIFVPPGDILVLFSSLLYTSCISIPGILICHTTLIRDRIPLTARMAASIEACPPEVVEIIVERLILADISSLRLTSRSLASLSAQDTFRRYFFMKHVDINVETLQSFVEVTKPGRLGRLVENLVLVRTAIDTTLLKTIL